MTELLKEQKSCECHKCRGACTFKPGWFLPGEAEKAAKLLKLPFPEFFRLYLGVDWWYGEIDEDEIFVLSPALVNGETGDVFPQNPQGMCIFYFNNRCRIHEAKPFECQMFWHGEKITDARARHKETAMAWKKHQKQIAKLLGRKPAISSPTVMDMFGFMTGLGGF